MRGPPNPKRLWIAGPPAPAPPGRVGDDRPESPEWPGRQGSGAISGVALPLSEEFADLVFKHGDAGQSDVAFTTEPDTLGALRAWGQSVRSHEPKANYKAQLRQHDNGPAARNCRLRPGQREARTRKTRAGAAHNYPLSSPLRRKQNGSAAAKVCPGGKRCDPVRISPDRLPALLRAFPGRRRARCGTRGRSRSQAITRIDGQVADADGAFVLLSLRTRK